MKDITFVTIVFFVLVFVFASSLFAGSPATVDLASDTEWQLSVDDGVWRGIKVPGGGYNSDLQDKPWIDGGTVKDHVTYKRSIKIPDVYRGQVTKIEFGGVNHGCDVYIDGKKISSHIGPMMPFEVDISGYVKAGRTYELKVQTYPQWHYDYSVPHGFIYEESYKEDKYTADWMGEPGWITKFSYGITKYVRLAVYPEVYIKDVFVRPSVANKSLTYDVWIHNSSKEEEAVTLESNLTSWNGVKWKYPRIERLEFKVGAGEIKKVTAGPVGWNLGQESYWWPNKPFKEDYQANLHKLNLTLKEDGKVSDRKTQRFGFVEWTEGPYYYMVNGVRINQISDGTPEPAMSEYDCYSSSAAFLPPTGPKTGCAETWKKFMRLGISANRIHQSTPTEYMMDVADELGFMIVAETPIRGCQEQKWTNIEHFTQSVKEMALYGRNHPSICRYSLLNEGTTKHVRELIDAIVTVDDTRPLVIEDNELHKPGRIEGKNGHAYTMLHYVDYPKPAKVITGMGEFAWRWVQHKQYNPNVVHADGGLEEFIYYGGDMRRWDIIYIAGWAFINYWPNFLEGMSYEEHAWKQSCYKKDRQDGVDGWDSPVVELGKKYFHPYLVMDVGIHERNKADSDPAKWPEHTSTYSAGERIERELEVFNDGLFGNEFTIKWEARWDSANGELVDSGVVGDLIIEPGFHKTVSVSFSAPDIKEDERKLFFVIDSKLEGKTVFREDGLYFLISPGIASEEAAKIKAAVPSKARVEPKKDRKLLVFSLCRSYVHSSIPYGKKVLEIMGKKTGAFEAVFSDDISVFEPENLKQFDAVFFNNNSGELFLPANVNSLSAQEQTAAKRRNAELEKSLADYIKSGGGFAGIHCAVWCFYDWEEYANIIGATWVSHPWHEKVSMKLDDAEHALCAAFGGKGFDITDEIYVFTKPYSRQKVRVLFSLDMNKTKAKEEFEGRRADGDYAQSWVKEYGKGRVFYSALGHDHDIFWNEAVLQHWLDGIQFALGDLEVDTTPK